MLDGAQGAAANAAAAEYARQIQEAVAGAGPEGPTERMKFMASIATQGALRSLLDVDADNTEALFLGAGEGVGMILGLIEDPVARGQTFQAVVRHMLAGMELQARIHEPQGNA